MGWGGEGRGDNGGGGGGTVWKGMREVDCGEKEFGEGNKASWRACRKFLIGRQVFISYELADTRTRGRVEN